MVLFFQIEKENNGKVFQRFNWIVKHIGEVTPLEIN